MKGLDKEESRGGCGRLRREWPTSPSLAPPPFLAPHSSFCVTGILWETVMCVGEKFGGREARQSTENDDKELIFLLKKHEKLQTQY